MKNKIRDISIIVLLVTLFCFIFMFLARLSWYFIVPLYLSLIFVYLESSLNFNRRLKIVLAVVLAACLLALQYYIDNYTVEGKYKHRLEKCKIFTETLQEKIKKINISKMFKWYCRMTERLRFIL
jgi:sulfite exporter TauE/SafE